MPELMSGVCEGRGAQWDLDQAHVGELLAAKAACVQCPIFDACQRHLDARVAEGDRPISCIQAGIAFGTDGMPLHTDDQLRRVIRRRRPMPPLPPEAKRLLGLPDGYARHR